jgi:diaminopimelate epimerase
LTKILTEEHTIEPPDHVDSSGSIKAKRTLNGWRVVAKWLYDRGNKEETKQFEVNNVSVQVLE